MTPNGPVCSGDLFFFYGLLKRGAAGMPAHIDLERGGAFLGDACIRGRMYDVGGYPGLVDGDQLCHGLLYRIDDTRLAPMLDDFEDVVPGDPAMSLYQRRKTAILDRSGRALDETAWVYWFNRDPASCREIKTGDWPLAGAEMLDQREA